MERVKKLVVGVAAAAVLAGIGGPAWGYGAEGWPHKGRPDHVVQAEARKALRECREHCIAQKTECNKKGCCPKKSGEEES